MGMNTASLGNYDCVGSPGWRYDSRTPEFELLQTQVSGNTNGIYHIFASATSNNDMCLMWVALDIIPSTVTCKTDLVFDETTVGHYEVGASGLTAASAHLMFNFAPYGCIGGTTTTYTTYVRNSVATTTVLCTAQALRKK